MSGHTPGPWRAINGNLIRVAPKNNPSTICGVHKRGVHLDKYDEAEVLANAYLIAATPEMYEALKACLDDLADRNRSRGYRMAQAALAKAQPPESGNG